LSSIAIAYAYAASDETLAHRLLKKVTPVRGIAPIFNQLLTFSYPAGFEPVFENTNGPSYIMELVPIGESVEKWSEMVTVTGAKELASNPNITPKLFVGRIAGRFKSACPNSFRADGFGALNFGGYDAYGAVISCGAAKPTEPQYSESALIVAIKGDKDYYTVQWAERGAATSSPITFDAAKWVDRLKKLVPINLCPIVPGEPAPYPSCIDKK
jgi:hypothetical protein